MQHVYEETIQFISRLSFIFNMNALDTKRKYSFFFVMITLLLQKTCFNSFQVFLVHLFGS